MTLYHFKIDCLVHYLPAMRMDDEFICFDRPCRTTSKEYRLKAHHVRSYVFATSAFLFNEFAF